MTKKTTGQGAGNRASQGTQNGRRQSSRSAAAVRAQKLRKQKRRKRFFTFLFLFVILLLLCIGGLLYLQKRGTDFNLFPSSAGKTETLSDISVNLESLDSPYAIMIDAADGSVIGSKQGDVLVFPASMTKILTVLTAIEQIKDLDRQITMSYDYYDTLYAQDASRAGFEPGEEAVIRDLLYGALLPSGAECCMELAIQASGSESAFVEQMNKKVKELGLTQTHFTNCTGLHNDDQYSTPHEIAIILQEALKNKTFHEVFTTHYYSVAPTSVHPDGFTFWSTMFKNMEADLVIGGEIMGGKTGYTDEAGHCLASMAEIDGREYIQVTAGWASQPRVSLYHINDAFLGYNALGRALEKAKEE